MSTELFPSNGCYTVACLHSCYLAMGLHVTIFLRNQSVYNLRFLVNLPLEKLRVFLGVHHDLIYFIYVDYFATIISRQL
jgi:phosphate starvation-inducible membrane PsiE